MTPQLSGRALCAAFLAALASAAASAQQTPSAVRESAGVSLVEVPVRVTDRNGQPMHSLRAQDFEIFDDGRKRPIVAFDVVDLADKARPLPASGGIEPAARRHFLLLFDFSFSKPRSILGARGAARQFVLSGMSDMDFAAVATYSVEKGVQLLVTFSNDRVQLARAIETLGLSPTEDMARDPLSFAFDIGHTAPTSSGLGGKEAQAAAIVETIQVMQQISRAWFDQYARGRVRRLMESLGSLARTLDAVSGRKDVIYLSEGFESKLLVGTKETDQERDWLTSGELWKVDQEKRFGSSTLREDLRLMGEFFRRSDCVLHAVDIGGLRMDPETAALDSYQRPTPNSLFELVEPTGGEVLRNDNNFKAQLDRLLTRTSLVYVLAFQTEKTAQEGKFHELKVKVHAPGAHVSARAGYYERRQFRRLSPIERNLSTADVLANEVRVHDVPLTVSAVAIPKGPTRATVPIWIDVSGGALLSGQKGENLQAEIFVYAYDSENVLRDFIAQSVELSIASVAEKLARGHLKYCASLDLPPGTYRIRVLVRNVETGRLGLAVLPFEVPAWETPRAYLAAPIFLEDSERDVLVRGRRIASAQEDNFPEYPLLDSPPQTLVPTSSPEIHAGRSSAVSVVAYHFGSQGFESLRVGGSVLSDDGRPVGEAVLAVRGHSTSAGGRSTLLLDFTPAALPPGRYALRVFLVDGATGVSAHASAPFLVP